MPDNARRTPTTTTTTTTDSGIPAPSTGQAWTPTWAPASRQVWATTTVRRPTAQAAASELVASRANRA